MAIYQVQADGKAPKGMKIGDQVVTGGGTYIITSVAANGSYGSTLYDQNQTTHNYTGGYDIMQNLPDSGSGSATQEQYTKLMQETLANNYQPTVSGKQANSYSTLSFGDAVKLAEQVMTPQYQERYQNSAAQAAQRLDKAGLYDSMYGQSLSMAAQNDVM